MAAARNTFLIDPQGVIRKVYTKVSPNPHSQEVLTDLAEAAEIAARDIIGSNEAERGRVRAGRHAGRFRALVVTDGEAAECEKLARLAAEQL